MSAYKYKVYDRKGDAREGELSASSLDEAEQKLTQQGDTVVSIVPLLEARNRQAAKAQAKSQTRPTSPSPAGQKRKLFGSSKANPAEVAATLRNLAVMAESGVPFHDSLVAVSLGIESPQLKASVDRISEQVLGGRSLGQAMRAASDVFPPIVCDMVSVGEESGKLDHALSGAASYLERSVSLRSKLTNALIYPAILLLVAGLTVFALIFFIMPKFGETFKGMNIKPPFLTQTLMNVGESASSRPWVFLLVLGAAVGGFFYAKGSPQLQAALVRLTRKIPLLGKVLRQLSVARMLQTLSSLMAGGVPLLDALTHSGRVAGDPDLEAAANKAREDVQGGGMLSESFRNSQALPPTIVQMMAVGEKTGQMPRLISRAADEMENQADARLKALMSIFEPMMILVMGAVVGLITFSLISPLFSVLQNVR
jgi:general secretion pathway protein F